jgi:hypothetical protein
MFTPFNDTDLDGLAAQKVAVVHPVAQDMHPSSRGYAANNVYPGFPPLMNDGRALIASWQPEAVDNQNLLKSSNVKSNWEYRKYLTHNAESIIKQNFAETANDCGYYNNGFNQEAKTDFLPIFAGLSKNVSPKRYDSYIQPEAEYGRFESDLKANYLSRETLNSRKVTPVISQFELLQWQKSQ